MSTDCQFEKLKEMLDIARPWISEEHRRSLTYLYQYSDPDEKRRVFREIEDLTKPFRDFVVSTASVSDKPLFSLPERSEIEGELSLGDVMLGDQTFEKYNVKLDDLTKHVFIGAPPGTGKTVVLYNIVLELARCQKPFTIIDTKSDFHYLLPKIPGLAVIHMRELRMNLFDPPPNVNMDEYLGELRRIFPHAWGFYQSGSGTYLSRKILEAYHRRNDGTVTLYDVADALQREGAQPSKKSEWHTVVNERVLETLEYSAPTFSTRNGFPLYQLLDLPLVIRVSGVGDPTLKLFLFWWLTYVILYRRAQGHRGPTLRHVLVLDEFQKLSSRGHQYSESVREMGDDPLEEFLRTCRDFGQGILSAAQESSRVHPSMLSSSSLILAGNQGTWEDTEAIAGAMNLRREEVPILGKLNTAEWLVKKRGAPSPYILKTPLVEIDRTLTEAQVAERMKPWIEKMRNYEEKAKPEALPQMTNEELLFLKAISERPFTAKSEIYDSLPGKRVSKVALGHSLVEKKVLRVEKVPLFSQKAMEFFVPSVAGIRLIYKNKFSGADRWYAILKSGTFTHSLIIFHAWRILSQYGRIEKEHRIPDSRKQPDLYCEIESRRLGVEVYVSPVVDAENVQSVLPHLDMIFMVCADSGILNNIRKAMENYGISENPKIRYYPNPYSFFADLRSRSTLYHLITNNTTNSNPLMGTHNKNKET
jgi:hypothetical protein